MTKFDDELTNGNFIISYCNKCHRFVWPPSDIVTYVIKLPPGRKEVSMVKSLNILKKRIIIFV